MALTSSRRTVLAGLAASLALPQLARAGSKDEPAQRLTIESRTLEVLGRSARVFGITNGEGKPGLSLTANQPFRATVANTLNQPSLLHWHGLTPPYQQDGVPFISQDPIAPGLSSSYEFINRHVGTFWMHSHLGLQEQGLLAAPLIVRDPKDQALDHVDHVVMFHDFTFRDPAEILAELQKGGGGHAAHQAMKHSMSGGDMTKMDMSGMDMSGQQSMLNDVIYDAYLANDRTLQDPEIVRVEPRSSVRLRIINASAASNMWVDLGSLEGELIAVDGHKVAPLKLSRIPLCIAQRADIRIEVPNQAGAWPILFLPEGVKLRAGIVLATAGAAISKIALESEAPAPALGLSTEARLRTAERFPQEPVTRTEMLMLTGGDKGYLWGLNGRYAEHETLFTVKTGERIDVMIHNTTAMAHPMHLHGHVFKVVNINGQAVDGALRDTVLVPPGQMVTLRFDADNPGIWAFHCHHLYHMNAGMMGTITYSQAA